MRLGCPQHKRRTWWQIVATPYTGLAELGVTCSGNRLFPQTVTWPNADLSIGLLGANISEIVIRNGLSGKYIWIEIIVSIVFAILFRPKCVNSLRPGDNISMGYCKKDALELHLSCTNLYKDTCYKHYFTLSPSFFFSLRGIYETIWFFIFQVQSIFMKFTERLPWDHPIMFAPCVMKASLIWTFTWPTKNTA